MWVFFATVAAALAVFSGGVAEAKCVVAFDGDPGTDICRYHLLSLYDGLDDTGPPGLSDTGLGYSDTP